MTARCDRCGRYSRIAAVRISQRATPWQGEEQEALCVRCLRLRQRCWDTCYEETADRDGVLGPCDRPAFDVRYRGEGGPYPVCRMHWRHYQTLRKLVES